MKQAFFRSTLMFKQLGERLRNPDRRVTVFIHDVLAMLVAVQLSFWIYFGENLTYFTSDFLHKQMLIFALLCSGFFLWFQTYRGIWRYVSATQILILAGAIGFASLLYLPLLTKASVQNIKISKMVVLINWAVAVSLVTASRLFYRAFTERWITPENEELSSEPTARLLMIGISRELEKFLTRLRQSAVANYEVMGIITENPNYIGRYIQGFPVLGTLEDLPDLIENFNAEGEHPHHLVLASKNFSGHKLRHLLDQVQDLKVDLHKLPHHTRSLDISPLSLEDFFTQPAYLDPHSELSTFYKSQKILIVGAGKLIGRQLAHYFLQIGVTDLVLCESNHISLAELRDDLAGIEASLEPHFILTHQYDQKKYNHLFSQQQPSLVIYLDGIYEDEVAEENPLETVAENILTPKMLIDIAAAHSTQHFVYVVQSNFSHETTIGPLSIKLAEAYCQSLDASQTTTRFIPIRLAPIVAQDSEFTYKMVQFLGKGKPIEINGPNQAYNLITPTSAAFTILKTLFISTQSPHIRGTTFAEVLPEKTTLPDFIQLLASLENIPLSEVGEILFTAGSPLNEGLGYQHKDTLHVEKETYELQQYGFKKPFLDDLFKNLQTALDQFDQNKALELIKRVNGAS